MARFGDRFDAQGVLSGSKDAGRCIGYLTKYLTKQVADCHQAQTDAQRAHAARLAEALRYQPCSPRCANWLRYGIQPKNARPGLVPGCCKGKAHDADHLGYAGRRVLVSRKWSGKTLADHRADRKEWLLSTLGVSATDPARYAWEPVAPADPDHMEHARRLLHAVADRAAMASRTRRGETQSPGSHRRSFGNWEGGMTTRREETKAPALLTVEQAAERLGTKPRFVRRLIAERRIEFHRVGRHVRISEGALADFIEGGRVGPLTRADHPAWRERSRVVPNRDGHRRFGNVRKLPSGRYQIRYPGLDGRMRTGPETYERKGDADKALVLIEAQMSAGEWTDPERAKIRLGDYASAWIAERPGLRPRTADLYRWLLGKHITPYLGGVLLSKLSTRLMREWRATLLA